MYVCILCREQYIGQISLDVNESNTGSGSFPEVILLESCQILNYEIFSAAKKTKIFIKHSP